MPWEWREVFTPIFRLPLRERGFWSYDRYQYTQIQISRRQQASSRHHLDRLHSLDGWSNCLCRLDQPGHWQLRHRRCGHKAALVVTGTTPAAGLTPGTSKSSTYTIQNPNTYEVTVTSITVNSIGVTLGTGTPAPCTSANSGVTAGVGTGVVSIAIPASSTTGPQTITLSMSNDSANGCQTAPFTPNTTTATS